MQITCTALKQSLSEWFRKISILLVLVYNRNWLLKLFEQVVIKHQGNKVYSVDYVVREKGKYIIFVKWGEDHVPGSPYHIEV